MCNEFTDSSTLNIAWMNILLCVKYIVDNRPQVYLRNNHAVQMVCKFSIASNVREIRESSLQETTTASTYAKSFYHWLFTD